MILAFQGAKEAFTSLSHGHLPPASCLITLLPKDVEASSIAVVPLAKGNEKKCV